MYRITTVLLFLVSAVFAQANETQKISYQLSDVKVEKTITRNGMNFAKVSAEGFENDKTLGAPALPVRSWLLQGRPESIQVNFKTQSEEFLENTRPYPVQDQECRCKVPQKPKFRFNARMYNSSQSPYTLTYLGAFRGTPVTRLDVRLATYDSQRNRVALRTSVELQHNTQEFSMQAGDYKDYLIVVPTDLVDGVKEFADWKRNRGYNVTIETVKNPMTDLKALSALIRKDYTEKGIDFVILVGDDQMISMFKVDTSGSYNTPTDLKYFTMDGEDDHIPDMFYGRIVASTVDQVASQLHKSIEFEQKNFKNSEGLKRMIGIASNEGSGPSDNDYIQSIEGKFQSALGMNPIHFYQNDTQNSNPTVLNQNLDHGALWLTYMGHGTGTDWPSMNRNYSTGDIRKIDNQPAVKPIVIDVACMNGRITPSYLGASFMRTETLGRQTFAFGAAAYYGGTVNISWHPPAVMAKGIAFEHLEKHFKHLGEALLAGQLYLAAHWNYEDQVIDNMEWYHLQGDPGMNIDF